MTKSSPLCLEVGEEPALAPSALEEPQRRMDGIGIDGVSFEDSRRFFGGLVISLPILMNILSLGIPPE